MQINTHKEVSSQVKKQVLMIAYYFPPLASAGTLRTLKFVKYLTHFNWQPFVLTVKNAHHLTFDSNLNNQIPEEAVIHKTKAILPGRYFRKKLNYNIDEKSSNSKLKLNFSRLFSFIKKLFYTLFFCPDEFVGWIPFALIKGLRVIKENKKIVLYSTSPPNTTHLIAYLLKKITRKYWIADFRDLWDQYPESYNPFGWKWKNNFDNYLEHLVLQNADQVIVISEMMKSQLIEKFPDILTREVTVITNGFDPEDFIQNKPLERDNQKCLILHTGTFSTWRKTPKFFEAIEELCNENSEFLLNIQIQLMGLVFNEVKEEINRLNLNSNFEILPNQSYELAIRNMKSADFLLLIVGDLPKMQNALPLKLFDYIGAQKPIIAIAPAGETANLINKYNLGFVANPDKKREIRNVLENAFNAWQYKKDTFETSFQSVQEKFDRKLLTRQFCDILEGLNA
jgi:glycosyltransferase involved in cell wall biosynthesis